MNLRFTTLQGFLSFIVATTSFILAIIAGGFFYWLEYERSEAASQQTIQHLMETVKSTASVASFANNPQIGMDVVNGLMQNLVVGRVLLMNNSNMRVVKQRSGNITLGAPITQKVYSPFDDKEVVGFLQVEANANLVRSEARQSAYGLVGWVTIIIILTAAIATIVIQRLLSRPVVNVVEQMNSVVPGTPMRLVLAIHLEKNELGVLVNGFNHLLDAMSRIIQDERALREQLEKMEKRMRQIFDTSTAGIVVVDAQGYITEANHAFLSLMRINAAEKPISSLNFFSIADYFFKDPSQVRSIIANTQPGTTSGNDFAVNEALNSFVTWVHLDIYVEGNDEGINRIQYVIYDISIRKHAEKLSQYEAHHDHLTSLPNRRNAELQIEQLLLNAKQHNQRVAFILIDLDGFKQVNDTLGHDAGDVVLVEVAKRLKHSIREIDFVSRLGGDEFLVVLVNVQTDKNVSLVAKKLITAISEAIAIPNDGDVFVGASIGIACFPENGTDRKTLSDAADSAMYITKRLGKNGYTFFGQDYVG